MTRKQIVKRALAASVVLGLVSIVGSGVLFPQLNKVAYSVEPIALEIDPEIRARIEHGEDNADAGISGEYSELRTAPEYRISPQVETEITDLQSEIDRKAIELEQLDRMEPTPDTRLRRNSTGPSQPDPVIAQRKADLRREINDLTMQQMQLIQEYYAPAAGSEPPGADGVTETAPAPTEYVEHSPGFWDGVNGRYILDKLFAIIYGIGQILIGAWAAVRWKKSK